MAKMVSFRQYVQEILRSATYKACEDSNCIVAIVNDLPGCVTQGDTFDKTEISSLRLLRRGYFSRLNTAIPYRQ